MSDPPRGMPSDPVGLIGAGRMGTEIGARLLGTGRRLVVYDRERAHAQRLLERGATAAASPADVAVRCGTVVLMVSDGPAVLDVLTGVDGLLRESQRLLLVDMTTIGVDESEQVAAQCAAAGADYVRCPVLGSIAAARAGRLIALLSGPPAAVEAAVAIVAEVVGTVHVLGSGEQARVAKLVANGLLAGSLLALLEGVALAERSGLPRDTMLRVLADSSVTSPYLHGAARRLSAADYEPNLSMDLLLKDLRLLEAAAARVGAPVPAASAARRAFRVASAHGLGERDPIAAFDVLVRGGFP